MPEKSPEIPRDKEISPEEKGSLELGKEDNSTAEKIRALKKMKEMVEGKKEEKEELPPERRLSPEEKRKIDGVIEKVLKAESIGPGPLVSEEVLALEKTSESLGEKIVEPILNKLEPLTDRERKEKSHQIHLLIDQISKKVKPRDEERLTNLLVSRDPIAFDTKVSDVGRSTRGALLGMLERVGSEKAIDRLVEYSQKVIESLSYRDVLVWDYQISDAKRRDQEAIKKTIKSIGQRIESQEIDEKKVKKVHAKVTQALEQINRNIVSLEK